MPSASTEPPILMQASVPGTLTKPGPYVLQDFTRAVDDDFALLRDRGDWVREFGWVNVCATAPETVATTSKVVIVMTATRRRIGRAAEHAIQ